MTPVEEKVIERIRKIQRLADAAGTEGEAQAAIIALQNLLTKHGLSKSDITEESKIEEVTGTVVVDTAGVRQHWKGWLGRVLADNFRCEVYWSHDWVRGHALTHLMFLGMESDVVCAQAAFGAATQTMSRLRDQHLYARADEAHASGWDWTNSDGKAASKAYMAGFITGLDEALKENANKMALVLVKDEKVKQHLQMLGLRSGGGSQADYYGDGRAAKAGMTDGKDYGRQSRSGKLGGSRKELNA